MVVDFIGHEPEQGKVDNLHFAGTLDEAARMAVQLSKAGAVGPAPKTYPTAGTFAPGQKYLRGLYSGKYTT